MTLFQGTAEKKLDRREAFRRVAEVAGGELLEGKRKSGDRVLFVRGPWRIWLDTYVVSTGQVTVIYTRVRAFFRGRRDLQVVVRKKSWLDRLVQGMGFGSPLPVDRTLLERYVVRGRPEPRVPSLFSAQGLTEAVLAVPSLRLQVKPASRKHRKRMGEDAGEVACQTTGVITDVEWLTGMVQVVAEALASLERVGEARAEGVTDP
ncbi:MAG: hypothetical protein PVJ02_04490 [Gemmatimonadota bacterium]